MFQKSIFSLFYIIYSIRRTVTPTPFVGQKTDGVKTVCFLLYIQIVAFASVSPPTVRSFYFFLPLSDGSVRDPKYSPSARGICSFGFSAVRAFEKSNLPVFEKKEQKKYRSAGIDPFSLRARSPNRTAMRSIRMPICSFLFGSRAKKRFIHAFFLLSMLLSTRTR